MANRIIAFSPDGTPLVALDGHHGSEVAARWSALITQQLEAQGIEPILIEFEPDQGGDETRIGVVGNLHRLRLETRRCPDGRRELLGLIRLADDADPRAAVAAAPEAVRGGLRLLRAPGQWATPLRPMRLARSRLAGAPTAQDARQQRRAARAARRGASE